MLATSFANFYFDGEPLLIGLFLGTSIHETSQVAAAGLIYEQQFNSPETLNIATVTKLIRNKIRGKSKNIKTSLTYSTTIYSDIPERNDDFFVISSDFE